MQYERPIRRKPQLWLSVLIALLIMSGTIAAGAGPASANTGGYPDIDAVSCGSSAWCKNGSIYSTRGYAYRNCTDYVAWKLQSLGVPDSKTRGLGNGGEWAANAMGRAGVTVNNVPAYGAAAVMPSTSNNPYGHVAFVEAVNSNGTITISEYNYGWGGTYNQRTATAASMGFTQFVHFGVSGSGNGIANGIYVKTASSGTIYVVAGNSAIPVPSWQSVGGEKPYITITEQQLAAMSPYPADGTYVTDYGSPSVYVIVGGAYFSVTSWSAVGGPKTTTTLPASTIGTRFRQYPLNGTYVKDYGSPSVYVVAGGAPFLVPSWESVGGEKVVAELPQSTIGTKLRQYPLNGTYVTDYGSPSVYVVAGGAGLRVMNWESVGGPKATTMLPENSVGTKLLPYPTNGTYIRGYSSGRIYSVQGGVTTYMPNWGPSGPQPYTDVDQWAITNQLNAVE